MRYRRRGLLVPPIARVLELGSRRLRQLRRLRRPNGVGMARDRPILRRKSRSRYGRVFESVHVFLLLLLQLLLMLLELTLCYHTVIHFTYRHTERPFDANSRAVPTPVDFRKSAQSGSLEGREAWVGGGGGVRCRLLLALVVGHWPRTPFLDEAPFLLLMGGERRGNSPPPPPKIP